MSFPLPLDIRIIQFLNPFFRSNYVYDLKYLSGGVSRIRIRILHRLSQGSQFQNDFFDLETPLEILSFVWFQNGSRCKFVSIFEHDYIGDKDVWNSTGNALAGV